MFSASCHNEECGLLQQGIVCSTKKLGANQVPGASVIKLAIDPPRVTTPRDTQSTSIRVAPLVNHSVFQFTPSFEKLCVGMLVDHGELPHVQRSGSLCVVVALGH